MPLPAPGETGQRCRHSRVSPSACTSPCSLHCALVLGTPRGHEMQQSAPCPTGRGAGKGTEHCSGRPGEPPALLCCSELAPASPLPAPGKGDKAAAPGLLSRANSAQRRVLKGLNQLCQHRQLPEAKAELPARGSVQDEAVNCNEEMEFYHGGWCNPASSAIQVSGSSPSCCSIPGLGLVHASLYLYSPHTGMGCDRPSLSGTRAAQDLPR